MNNEKIKLLLCTLLACSLSPRSQGADAKIKWSLASFISSQKLFRGAVLYPDPIAFAGPGLTLYNRLSIRGPTVVWTQGTRKDTHQWILMGKSLHGGARFPLFRLTEGSQQAKDYRARYPYSFELSAAYRYRFGFRKLFSLGIELAQEVYRHHGQHLTLSLGLPLYKFLSLTSQTGVGTSAHNHYLYGEGSRAGWSFQGLALRYVIPRLPWKGIIILEASQHWVLQRANRKASFIRESSPPTLFRTHWIYSF